METASIESVQSKKPLEPDIDLSINRLLLLMLLTNADNRNRFQYWDFFNARFCLSKYSSEERMYSGSCIFPFEIRDQFSIRKNCEIQTNQTNAEHFIDAIASKQYECEFIYLLYFNISSDNNSILVSVWQPVHIYCYLLFSMYFHVFRL